MKILNLDMQAREMSMISGISFEKAWEYLEAQDAYYDAIGVNIYPDEYGNYGDEPAGPIEIDDDEMTDFILGNSSLDREIICRLIEADLEYLARNGFIDQNHNEM